MKFNLTSSYQNFFYRETKFIYVKQFHDNEHKTPFVPDFLLNTIKNGIEENNHDEIYVWINETTSDAYYLYHVVNEILAIRPNLQVLFKYQDTISMKQKYIPIDEVKNRHDFKRTALLWNIEKSIENILNKSGLNLSFNILHENNHFSINHFIFLLYSSTDDNNKNNQHSMNNLITLCDKFRSFSLDKNIDTVKSFPMIKNIMEVFKIHQMVPIFSQILIKMNQDIFDLQLWKEIEEKLYAIENELDMQKQKYTNSPSIMI